MKENFEGMMSEEKLGKVSGGNGVNWNVFARAYLSVMGENVDTVKYPQYAELDAAVKSKNYSRIARCAYELITQGDQQIIALCREAGM